MMKKLLSDTLKIKFNDMSKAMLLYSFPCGETNCYEAATREFEIATIDSQYKMPVCSKHAKWLEREFDNYGD